MSFVEKRILAVAVYLIISVTTAIANVAIITLICRKRQLHHVRFYIIANFSVADVLTSLGGCINVIVALAGYEALQAEEGAIEGNKILLSMALCTMVNSLLTAALLAVDRYIAVKYSLRYESILTKNKVFVTLGIIWAASVVIAGIAFINASNYFDYKVHVFITLTTLRIFVGALLISISKYTSAVANRHLNAINKRRQYFGVEKEKQNKLKRVKDTLKDSFKLYIATIVVMVILTVIGTIETIFSKNYIKIKMLLVTLLQLVELIVISLTQREIRLHLKHGFIMCGKSNTNPNVNNV